MPKKLPPAFQDEAGRGVLPKTLRDTYAAMLKRAEHEYRDAQEAVRADDSEKNRAQFARTLYDYNSLQGMFPFVAAGRGDVQA